MVSKSKGKQTPMSGYYAMAAAKLYSLCEYTGIPKSVYLREALDDLLRKYASARRKSR